MTKSDYKRFAKKHLRKHGLDEWTVEFSGRMKKDVGKAVFKSKTRNKVIVLSKAWFVDYEDQINDTEELKDVILHEVSHCLDIKRRGKSGHGLKWKMCARKVGADPTRTTDAVPRSLKAQVADWKRVCPECKQVAGYYFSKPTSEKYACALCCEKHGKKRKFKLEIKPNK